MEKVSIVIPTFNRASLLREALESAFSQDYPNYEVVVVDDGSVDSTPEVCRRFWAKHENMVYVRKQNGGPASALNMGVSASSGTWVKWFSDDDSIYPDCISRLMEYVTPDAGAVCGDFAIKWHGLLMPIKQQQLTSSELEQTIVYRNYYHAFGMMIRKEVLGSIPFREVSYGVDYDWMKRAVMSRKVKFVHAPHVVAIWRYSMRNALKSDPKALLRYPFLRLFTYAYR